MATADAAAGHALAEHAAVADGDAVADVLAYDSRRDPESEALV